MQGQQDCGQGLVCAATADAEEGVCIPICEAEDEGACEVGKCTACNDGDFAEYGVCLDAWSCDGMPCPVAGCFAE